MWRSLCFRRPAVLPTSEQVATAWSRCLVGDRVIARLTLLAVNDPPVDRDLRIDRRYPPSNASFQHAGYTVCDFIHTLVALESVDYTLNATTPTLASTWTAIKELYADRR